MNQAFLDYYKCPDQFADFRPAGGRPSGNGRGYFRFGADVVCYGRADVPVQATVCDSLPDALSGIRMEGPACFLPFDPTEIANNLRYEHYVNGVRKSGWNKAIRELYYVVRPALPVAVRRHLQRTWLKSWKQRPFPRWPVDRTVDQMFERLMAISLRSYQRVPFVWFWPEGRSSCAIMTHDVETASGLNFARELMDINDSFGIKSSFQMIPDARYEVNEARLGNICSRGFEINVHDLKHDGHLFDDYEQFLRAAERINEYARRFGSKGFRSGALYRNQDWYHAFSFAYDMSVPNVGHLDPQPGGCCTVMPYFVGNILELPLTTTQDYSLFNILGVYSLDLWQEQIGHIMKQHGLISFIVHPDYLDTTRAKHTYTALLAYLAELRQTSGIWTALPREVDDWWRQRNRMRLVPNGSGWRIEGEGAERARVAYATLANDEVSYVLG